MIQVEAKITGPLFDKPDLLLANVRAGNETERILGPAVRAAFSGGIVRRGPGRYGHVADVWRTQTVTNGWTVTTRVFPRGKAAFKALFLEEGRPSGLYHIYPTMTRRRAGDAAVRRHAAALKTPWGFRRNVAPSPAPAFRVLARVLEAQWPRVQAVFARELGRAVGAS